MTATTRDSTETLLKADSVQLAVRAEKPSGNLRLTCSSWDSPRLRSSEGVELRFEHGQVVVAKVGRAPVDAPLGPEMFEAGPDDCAPRRAPGRRVRPSFAWSQPSGWRMGGGGRSSGYPLDPAVTPEMFEAGPHSGR